jgi:hypothetical protein
LKEKRKGRFCLSPIGFVSTERRHHACTLINTDDCDELKIQNYDSKRKCGLAPSTSAPTHAGRSSPRHQAHCYTRNHHQEAPLASGGEGKATPVIGQDISYSYGKDGLHVMAVLARPARTIGEVRVSAIMPNGELLVAAQRAAADEQGAIHLDVSSVAIPPASTALKITLPFGAKDDGRTQEFLLSLRPANGTLSPAAKAKGRAGSGARGRAGPGRCPCAGR